MVRFFCFGNKTFQPQQSFLSYKTDQAWYGMVVILYSIVIEAFLCTYLHTYLHSFLVCGHVFHLMGDACCLLDYIGSQEEEKGYDAAAVCTERREVSRLG